MASPVGGQFLFDIPGGTQTVNLGLKTGTTAPATVAGALNIEVFANVASGVLPTLDSGFTAGVIDNDTVPGDAPISFVNNLLTGRQLTLFTGNYRVTDVANSSHSSAQITAGSGNQTVHGAPADTVTGGSGTQLLDGLGGNQSIVGGSGPTTIFGASGDTIVAGSNTLVDGTAGNQRIAVGSSATGSDTVFGSSKRAAGVAADTLSGGAATVLVSGLGAGDVVNFAGQTGSAVINALVGNVSVTLGSGPANVFGGVGDTIALGSGAQYVDGTAGGMKIVAGSAGTDVIFGSTAGTSVTGADSISGGGAGNVVISALGKGDTVNFAAQTGAAVINALIGGVTVTAGGGGASVFAGAGSTVTLGSVGQYVDATAGNIKVQVGTGGTDTVFGSAATGFSDTISGNGAGNLLFDVGSTLAGGSDRIDRTGATGSDTINLVGNTAISFTVKDTVIAGNNADTVFAGTSDRVGVGGGSVVAGTHVWDHSGGPTTAGVGFGTNDTVVATTYNTVAGTVSVNSTLPGASSAKVSVTNFNTTTDSVFYPGENAATDAAIRATAVTSGTNTIITLPDGTQMTFVGGITPALLKFTS